MATRALGRPVPPPARDRVVVKGPGAASRLGHPCPSCLRPLVAVFGDDRPIAECVGCGHRARVRWQGGAR